MKPRVTITAERDQVFFGILTGMTPKFLVMNLEIFQRSAALASPSIALKNRFAKLFVGLKRETHRPVFWAHWVHEAIRFACSRNLWRCSQGRNLKKFVIELSKISGFPLSKLAPARKSAQIISRQ